MRERAIAVARLGLAPVGGSANARRERAETPRAVLAA
jgi:hypothetical protein